jgi:hypothetical protein
LVGLFDDVFERVIVDYVDAVNGESLIENAINGMLVKLDPYGSYIDARAFRDLNDEVGAEHLLQVSLVREVIALEAVSQQLHAFRPFDPRPRH